MAESSISLSLRNHWAEDHKIYIYFPSTPQSGGGEEIVLEDWNGL